MNQYAIMLYPSANRVYADASIRLLASELSVFDQRVLGGKLERVTETDLGGVPYVTFTAPGLTDQEIGLLSNLSTVYALFAIDGEALRPIRLHRLDRFDSDLLTIQKYSGKTNELFTKLLLNVTALSTDTPRDLVSRRLRVLDPLCGRGTTLNQAMMYGFDASGLDADAKDFDEYSRFIRTWLKNKRLKHQAAVAPIRREHRQLGRRLSVMLAASKEEYRAGETVALEFVNADTLRSAELFRQESFDLVVTDAPYGVQHGARKAEQLSRSPAALLAAALPGWVKLLRPGGALGLSWNTKVAPRQELAGMLAAAGLQVCDAEPYLGFAHRVDQAIVRDILVASKPR